MKEIGDLMFCPYCGIKQEKPKVFCGYCGAEMDHDAVYCNNCGKKSFLIQQKEEEEARKQEAEAKAKAEKERQASIEEEERKAKETAEEEKKRRQQEKRKAEKAQKEAERIAKEKEEQMRKAKEEAERQEKERKAREERERKAKEEERKKKELEEEIACLEAEIRENGNLIKELEEKVRLKEEQKAREEKERRARDQMGHTAIDLGLPSGTKWSSCNLGAVRQSGIGALYAWGMTSEKNENQWISYEERIEDIGNNICGSYNDPAWWNLEKKWKMPSREQAEELVKYCTYEWTTLNGTKGCRFTGPNGYWIFLPAAGYNTMQQGSRRLNYGLYGKYWTGTRDSSDDENAFVISFEFGNVSPHVFATNFSFCYGMSIRPVLNE